MEADFTREFTKERRQAAAGCSDIRNRNDATWGWQCFMSVWDRWLQLECNLGLSHYRLSAHLEGESAKNPEWGMLLSNLVGELTIMYHTKR